MSLWALASSPLILGSDLTHLAAADLALLRNRSVVAVDQDAIDASRPASVHVYLELQRSSPTSYTGYYATDPADGWHVVGTATVPAQASTQDAGLFVSSHTVGSPARVAFRGLNVTDGATPPTTG
jgi:hypothetical protein